MVITSTSNEKIKSLRRLYREKTERDSLSRYVAEGVTMVKDLDKSFVECLYIKASKAEELSFLTEGTECCYIKDDLFDSLADTKTPSGVIAIVKKKTVDKSNVGDTTAVLCGVSDSGNVGAIMRTACARGLKTLFFVDCADPYSPKAVRASMSAVQKLNIVITGYEEVFSLLAQYEKLTLDADGTNVYDYKRKEKIAFFIGNEAHGVPDEVKERCDKVLSIPMEPGSVESLNAAVAASVAMYLVR